LRNGSVFFGQPFAANLLGFYWGLYVDREKKLAAALAFGEKNLE
jgi:hypothetical protein